MKKTFFIAFLILNACSSMKDQVYSKIHIGDPSSKVNELLGHPDSFGPSQRIPGAMAWYYHRKDQCAFTINNDVVAFMACDRNPNYVGPARIVGAFLQGAGNGLTNSRDVSCVSTTTGNTTHTNCN